MGGKASQIFKKLISRTEPTNGQALTYNSTTGQWEPQSGGVSATEYETSVTVDDGSVNFFLTKLGTLVFCMVNFKIDNFVGNSAINIHTAIIPESFRPNINNRATGVQAVGRVQTSAPGAAGVPTCLIQLYNNGWVEIYKDAWQNWDAGMVSSEPGAILMSWSTSPFMY